MRTLTMLAALLAAPTAMAGEIFVVNADADTLEVFDTSTLSLSAIGPLGVAFDFGDIAYDPVADVIWMIDGRPTSSLYRVDPATGAATLVGAHGITDLFGLELDPTTGILYGSGESPSGLYRLDKGTGAAALVGDAGTEADDLAWYPPTGELFGLGAGGGDVYAFSTVDGSTDLRFEGPFINNHGWAWDADTGRFWAFDWSGNVYSYGVDPWDQLLEASGLPAMGGAATGAMGGGPDLTILGSCPGEMDIRAEGLTPGGAAAVIYGPGAGSSVIPGGPCAGVRSGLAGVRLLLVTSADGAGRMSMRPSVPPGACGLSLQVLDVDTCTLTDVETL